MKNIIILAGAPGSGKTSVCELLKNKLDSVYIDFGRLREFHLDREWKKQSEDEELMAFENLISIVNNYVKHGYRNIIIDDLRDFRVQQIPGLFEDFIIFTLCPQDDTISERIKTRASGWGNIEEAIIWNQSLHQRNIQNEYKIDNTNLNPEQTLEKIIEII